MIELTEQQWQALQGKTLRVFSRRMREKRSFLCGKKFTNNCKRY